MGVFGHAYPSYFSPSPSVLGIHADWSSRSHVAVASLHELTCEPTINQLEVVKTLAVSGQCIQRHTHASHISPRRLTTPPPLIQLLFHQPLCAQVNPSLLGPLPLSVMDFL